MELKCRNYVCTGGNCSHEILTFWGCRSLEKHRVSKGSGKLGDGREQRDRK